MDNSITDVLGAWKGRIERAQQNAKGLTFEFHSSFMSADAKEYHAHKGEKVGIVSLMIDPGSKCGDCEPDEETLPFFVGRFNDGIELVCGFEEAFTHDERLLEFKSAVNAGFNISRGMDYISPHDLAENGTDEEKARFAKEVQALSFGNDQNFNTPPEYRESPILGAF